MNLQQLNKKIHQASKSELVANLATFKTDIANALTAGESEAYYRNHTGRELYRKLHNFGLGAEITSIGDAHDNGLRPLTVAGIKNVDPFDPSFTFPTSDGSPKYSPPYPRVRIIDSWNASLVTGEDYDLVQVQISGGVFSNMKLAGTLAGEIWASPIQSGATRGTDWEILKA